MQTCLGILIVALMVPVAWTQEISTAPVSFSLLLQTNVAAREATPVELSVKRAEIALSGRVAPPLHYIVNLDPATTLLKDAAVSWEFATAFAVTAGNFKYPQNLEGGTPSGQLYFIEKTRRRQTYSDETDGRAFGVQGGGRWRVLEYAAAAVNDRTWAARMGVYDGAVLLGLSGLYGRIHDGRQWRFGLEGRVKSGPWTWQAEIVWGDEILSRGSFRKGWLYAFVARRIGRFRPAVRLEEWWPELSQRDRWNDDLIQRRLTAGVDWFLAGDDTRGSKLSLNATDKEQFVGADTLLLQWQILW